jgi:cytoskeleton protein RodZ
MATDRSGDFGTKLREARERKGVSLRQIANKTKISVAALEALERNDVSRLPGGIFSRAFVRSYAAEVGLDPETTIQEFIAQFPHDSVTAGHPTSDQVEDFEELESDRRMASNVLWILMVSVPLAGAVLYFSMTNRARQSEATTAQPSGSSVAAENPPAPAAAAPAASDAPPAPPAAVPSAVASSGPPPEPRANTPAATPAPASAATGAAASSDAAVDVLSIGLLARRPVWVSATVDGQRTISRLLQTGEKQTVDIRREMVITAGDAAALSVTLNGAEARAIGKAGEVVTARISLSNFKDFLAR